MSEFMCSSLKHVCSFEVFVSPILCVIKVSVPTVDWKEGVSQSSTLAIEGVSVPMSFLLEPDKDLTLLNCGPDQEDCSFFQT